MYKFAERLSEIIEEKGLTLEEISSGTNISINSLKGYIKGGVQPRTLLYIRLVKYLGVSLDYMLGLSDKKTFTNN